MGTKRTFLFALSADEQAHPNKLVGFASKLPAINKTNDEYVDDDLRLKREGFMTCISLMWRNPHIILQTTNRAEHLVQSYSQRSTGDFFESISVLWRLDETWTVNFISVNYNLSIRRLEQACTVDPDSWRHLMVFGLVANGSLKMPAECKEKLVCQLALAKRMERMGSRLLALTDSNILHQAGGIDWGRLGVYAVTWNASGRAESVLHRPSGHEASLAEHVVITKKFTLASNWSDFGATLSLKPTSYNIAEDFFEAGRGPHSVKLWTGHCKDFDTEAAAMKSKVEKDRKGRADVTVSSEGEFRKAQKTEQRRQSMQKAREALSAKKDSLANKRKITFDA